MALFESAFRYARGAFLLEATFAIDNVLLVVVGASGAGKSTLLRVLAGLEQPIAGSAHLRLGGADFAHEPAMRRPFGYLAQSPALLPHVDVLGNVLFGARRLARPERAGAAEEAIALCGLEHLALRRASLLSGGERQRVAFARALASRPCALLLDEPFSALDPALRRRLADFVRELRLQTPLPCIHVTHDAAEALYLGDSVALVAAGRLGPIVPVARFLADPGTEPALLSHLLPNGGTHVEALARLWNATRGG